MLVHLRCRRTLSNTFVQLPLVPTLYNEFKDLYTYSIINVYTKIITHLFFRLLRLLVMVSIMGAPSVISIQTHYDDFYKLNTKCHVRQ